MATTMRLARQLTTAEPGWTRRTGVVVVGAGAAGLGVAVGLLRAGIPSVLLCREGFTASATAESTAAPAAWREPAGVDEILALGAGLAERPAVESLVRRAPGVMSRLDAFARSQDTRTPDPRQPAGMQVLRTLSSVVRTAAMSPAGSLRIDTHRRAVDVLTDEAGRVAGLRVLCADGTIGDYLAPAVVLACGGAGQLWSATTAPRIATGDGLAMALRAGAALRDVEFVEFTATALAVSERMALPGEPLVGLGAALRRAGARIVDAHGRPALAGQDQLEQQSQRKLAMAVQDAQDAQPDRQLYLDARTLGERAWGLAPHLATAMACREHGVDPVHLPLPIRTAAQSMIGGIAVDRWGATRVPGLFAVGEAACTGARGAAGPDNASLVEALVGAAAAGAGLAAHPLPEASRPVPRDPQGCTPAAALQGIRAAADSTLGLVREHEQLRSAMDFLSRLPADDELDEPNLTATNLRAVGGAICAASTARPETRGWHRRADHPESSPKWLRTITVACEDTGSLAVTSDPVAG